MKKIICLLVVLVAFMGCQMNVTDSMGDSRYKDRYRTQLYYTDFSCIKTQADIVTWMRIRVAYAPDPEGTDEVTPLKETIKRRYGDCEEFALLYLDILYVRFGIKGQFLMVSVPDRQVAEGGDFNHAVVRVNGVQIEPQTGKIINYQVAFFYDFDELFY